MWPNCRTNLHDIHGLIECHMSCVSACSNEVCIWYIIIIINVLRTVDDCNIRLQVTLVVFLLPKSP